MKRNPDWRGWRPISIAFVHSLWLACSPFESCRTASRNESSMPSTLGGSSPCH
jgi:hypothetical protein